MTLSFTRAARSVTVRRPSNCSSRADWAYAISAGLRDRPVVPAVAGLIAGYAGYTLLAVADLVVIVASSPTVLTALTVAGAAYLMWLGLGVLSRPVILGASTEAMPSSRSATRGQIMLKGAGISCRNPKALLLHFSLFPQFIDSAGGRPVSAQTGLLGMLHMTACTMVCLSVGVLARTLLRTRPSAALAVTRTSGAMMIVNGGFLLAERLTG
ncbi:LysE family translocator [Streptomyces sp. NPDC055749]